MPYDDGGHFIWKRLAGTIAIAEWGWTPNFPKDWWLKDLWFKPFMMCEKEVPW
ncbi:MAG: hypothetical protein JSW52_07215 [Candidatus Coatesbacteria bacterium]|nr:MAG: hypothetical protein JSW52_07215 [Candidatus Coatesbacteria bacterium]